MSSAPTVRNTAAASSANKEAAKAELLKSNSNVSDVSSDKDSSSKGGDSNSKPGTSKFSAMTNQFLKKFPLMAQWKSRRAFVTAQYQVFGILAIAYAINNWPVSYPREENHKEGLFWCLIAGLVVAAVCTMKHEPDSTNRGVQLLSRDQTEEWKGWMQFVFIMYHYYRNRSIYNEIRVFVSAYVWMTGFGNFLYFDKKQDFSLERMVSMWMRINYFPIMLSLFLGVKLELYYVVPLHTVGFFMTMATCYLAKVLRDKYPQKLDHEKANMAALGICLLVHVLFFETSAKGLLTWFSPEYSFRFGTDKYSAWIGMVCGFLWGRFKTYMQWCYGVDDSNGDSSAASEVSSGDSEADTKKLQNPKKQQAMYIQRASGFALILGWYFMFGSETNKVVYNPRHPFVFWMPIAGFLLLRNSSKRLTEMHSTVLEFLGRITLETYVLQFHVFMCKNVQFIPVVIPGSGVNGLAVLKFVNMLITGAGFIALSWYARQSTIVIQESVTELVTDMKKKYLGGGTSSSAGQNDNLMKTKPTLGIIDEPEDSTPMKGPQKDKKDEEE